MPKRIKIGDVVEIKTKNGMAYAQFVYKHDRPPKYGALIRVLPGNFSKRPASFSELVKKRERFVVFFPLGAAVNRGLVTVVANEAIPEHAKKFPIFRVGGLRDQHGKVKSWSLWDGQRTWKVGELTPAQRKLPISGIVNLTALVMRIDSDWTPEKDKA